jgi:membrane-associated phospholipid phosphatase
MTFPERLSAILHEHALLLGLVCAYIVSAAAFLLATGHRADWVIRGFYVSFTVLFILGAAVRLLASRSSRRFDRIAGAALVGLIVPPFQSTFNSVKQGADSVYGYAWDARLADIDRRLHFGRQPWEWIAPLAERPGAIRFLDLNYMLWFPVLLGFLLWAAWSEDRALRRRALLAAVLVWVLCGNVAAIALSSAGPCYYGSVVSGNNPYAGLMTTLDAYHRDHFLFARFNQAGLWNAMQSHTWLPFGGISAMPSVHVAMAVLLALVGWRRNATAGTLLTIFAVLTMIGSVALGWHYAIDGYVGALMAYAIWRAVRWCEA